ncbi:MAG: hypothetical protein ABFE07_25335 [Armatimonadia bacterium]
MNAHLVSEDDLRAWLQYERQADIKAWLDDKGVWYVTGKGGRICTTVEAINDARARAANAASFDEFEFVSNGTEAQH